MAKIVEMISRQRRDFLLNGALAATGVTTLAAEARVRKQIFLIAESNASMNQKIPTDPLFRKTVDYVERELGVKFEYRRYPWKRLLLALNEGEGLAFGLSKTTERLKTLHFSIPAFASFVWIVTRSDAKFEFEKMSDLRGRSVGVVRGATYGDEFDQFKNQFSAIEEDVFSLPSRLQKLMQKRTDLMLFTHRDPDARKVEELLNKLMPELAPEFAMPAGVQFSVLRKPMMVDYIHFAIRAENDDGLIQRINSALIKGKRRGELPLVVFSEK
jgi:polar amino acid transport system substrate-binding protein